MISIHSISIINSSAVGAGHETDKELEEL